MKRVVSLLLIVILMWTIIPSLAESKIKAGNIVTFGNYDQNNKTSDGKEAIEWIVLKVDGDNAFLLSRYVLASRPFHSGKGKIDWSKCSLRKWLNETFYKAAFSGKENKAIIKTKVNNTKKQSEEKKIDGKESTDKVFLLSYAELARYFPEEKDRRAVYTDTAIKESLDGTTTLKERKKFLKKYYDGCYMYLLRSVREGFDLFTTVYWPECVMQEGEMSWVGCSPVINCGIRPAIYVNLKTAGKLIKKASSGK